MQIRKILIPLLVCFSLVVSTDLFAAENTPDVSEDNALLRVSGGCIGGTIFGSFLPIVGNIVGCAVGGLVGYFWPDDEFDEELGIETTVFTQK